MPRKPGSFVPLVLIALIAALSLLPVASFAGPDEDFARARELGFAGNREEARAICRQILEDHPDYHDVRVFLGRLYAWDKDYDRARAEFRQVLEARPDHVDARSALADVELWSDNPQVALTEANVGLERNPGDSGLLVRKGLALEDMGMDEEALAAAREAVKADPDSEEANNLVARLKPTVLKNKVGLDVRYDDVTNDFGDDKTYDEWWLASFEYSRKFDFGSIIWRYNWAERFDITDRQFEIDAYPKLGEGRYLYVNAGWSPEGDFLADWRYGLEYFQGLPKSWETSIGARYLDFGDSDSIIYTASLGRYYGVHFTYGRIYYTPDVDDHTPSVTIAHRHYWADEDSYIEFSAGAGTDIEDDPAAGATGREATLSLDTIRADVEVSKRYGNWVVSGEVGWREEEFPFFDRTLWTLAVGVERLF